ncbi:hypothetical protein AP058_00180 [Flavobacterium sp. TAB 87]|nr:hypothetical protein AP058_00180 [Flavobacterium sp. TAB 87]
MMMNKNSSTINNNWYVIAGGPSTGKSTVINLLHKLAYNRSCQTLHRFLA